GRPRADSGSGRADRAARGTLARARKQAPRDRSLHRQRLAGSGSGAFLRDQIAKMIKRFLAAAVACSVSFTPAAFAQEEAAAPEPRAIPLRANPDVTQDLENILLLDLSNGGLVAIRLVPVLAPSHVERIKTLTRQGFYDGVIFHRVIDGFMAQTGDPTGTGRGGSELPDLEAEFNMFPHVRGSVAMARAADRASANSQFFIVFYPRFSPDRNYPNVGSVIA